MNKLFSLKRFLTVLAASALWTTSPSEAALVVETFGPEGLSVNDGIDIPGLGTTLGRYVGGDPERHAISSSNDNIRFVRHLIGNGDCFYWFRAEGDPTQYTDTQQWDTVYWYIGNVFEGDSCYLPDGAADGDDNFVLLYSMNLNRLVGVAQLALNTENDPDLYPARLLAYAYDLDGVTYREAVDAIQNIPEPGSVLLCGAMGLALMKMCRRRNH